MKTFLSLNVPILLHGPRNKLPIHGMLTDTKIDRDAISIDYSDQDGQIVAMNNCSPNTHFRVEERYFQAFTSDGDDLTIADCYIEAPLFEHQLTDRAGMLYLHPFLKIFVTWSKNINYLNFL